MPPSEPRPSRSRRVHGLIAERDLFDEMLIRLFQGVIRDLERHNLSLHTVNFNASATQFRDLTYWETLRPYIERLRCSVRYINLEITEHDEFSDTAQLEKCFAFLSDLGVGVVIDDYGAGYSDMTRLNYTAVCGLKIDRTLTQSILSDASASLYISSIIETARRRGIRVTGEGIETSACANAMKAIGCDSLQGFLYSKPVDISGLAEMVRAIGAHNTDIAEGAPA